MSRVFTVSGTATGAKRLYVKHRAAGGAGCAPTAFADAGTWPDASFYGAAVNGPFSLERTLAWGKAGTWMFCFWLAADQTPITTASVQTITFREPAGTIGAAVYPAVPRPGQRAQITVAGTTESSRRVYAKIRSADGPPCASSYDVDPGGEFVEGWSVDGAFSINANATEADPGTYLICLWLAGDSADSLPIGGVRQQTYTVVRPPTPRALLDRDPQLPHREAPQARRSARDDVGVHALPLLDAARGRALGVGGLRDPPPRHVQDGEHDVARRHVDDDDLQSAARPRLPPSPRHLVRRPARRRRVGGRRPSTWCAKALRGGGRQTRWCCARWPASACPSR